MQMNILDAARSYYGLSDTESCITQLFTNQAGQACVAFEIPLSPADFLAIGERMKAMQEADNETISIEDLDSLTERTTADQFNDLRDRYNSLSAQERGKYGSFARFAATSPIAPETEEPTTMDAVWLDTSEVSDTQWMNAEEHDGRKCLLPWSMLTEEQRQKAKEKEKL